MPKITIKASLTETIQDLQHTYRNGSTHDYKFSIKHIDTDKIEVQYLECNSNCACHIESPESPESDLTKIKEEIDYGSIVNIYSIISNNPVCRIKDILNSHEDDYDKRVLISDLLKTTKVELTNDLSKFPFNAEFKKTTDNTYEATLHINEKCLNKHLYITIDRNRDDGGWGCFCPTHDHAIPLELTLMKPFEFSSLHHSHQGYLILTEKYHKTYQFTYSKRKYY